MAWGRGGLKRFSEWDDDEDVGGSWGLGRLVDGRVGECLVYTLPAFRVYIILNLCMHSTKFAWP